MVEAGQGLCLLVCGGREYADAAELGRVLDRTHALHLIAVLIHGGARGADTLAGEWAASRGIAVVVYMADWNGLGRKAGPIRNAQMLREGRPDAVIAFPGGRGTANMVLQAKDAGVPVWQSPT